MRQVGRNGKRAPAAPTWLWWGSVSALAAVLLAGLGLMAALALGWRSPTPHRLPDWTAADSVWSKHGDGTMTSADADSQQPPAALRVRLSQPEQRAWAIASQHITDFDLELDARLLLSSEDVGYGLLYRYQDPANTYLFAIGGDGYYTIAVVQKGVLTPLRAWQQWPHVRRGAAVNRLRVRCVGATCCFYVNGEFTAEITDEAFLAGDLGLWAQTFSDGPLDVVFEEVRLWSLN